MTRKTNKKKILWMCSTLLPAVANRLGMERAVWIPWVATQLDHLKKVIDAEICVVTSFPGVGPLDITIEGVRYVVLRQPRRLHHWRYSWSGFRDLVEFLTSYSPDLVHIHGTENYLGLVPSRSGWRGPVVVSLQGLMKAVAKHALGPFSIWDAFRMDRARDLARMSGLLGNALSWRRAAQVESLILKQPYHFVGRTQWDKSQLFSENPEAIYSHVGEIIRPEFYFKRWTAPKNPAPRLFFSNLAGPHKGGDLIVRALSLLKRVYPNIRFRVSGRLNINAGYGRWLASEAERLKVSHNLEFIGFLTAEEVAKELLAADVFVSASYIDNSPNSVAEAMLVGTPVVASFVGGLAEMLENGAAGLYFPPGDSEMLACRVRCLLSNGELSQSLSIAGREIAVSRHSPEKVMKELLAVYGAVTTV